MDRAVTESSERASARTRKRGWVGGVGADLDSDGGQHAPDGDEAEDDNGEEDSVHRTRRLRDKPHERTLRIENEEMKKMSTFGAFVRFVATQIARCFLRLFVVVLV